MRGLQWGWHGSVVWVDGVRPGAAQGWRLREVPTNSRLPGMSRTAGTGLGWVGSPEWWLGRAYTTKSINVGFLVG